GSGTQINNVQVSYGNDDAYEFFGGTVNAKNLISFAAADDDYDFDFGYVGRIQFAVALRDPNFVDAGDAGNGVECDNDGSGSNALPYTRPVLSNFTWVGPNNQPASNGTVLTNHNFNMRWRRATSFSVHNSILMGYNRGGFSIESDTTANGYKLNTRSAFRNNLVHAVASAFRTSATTLLTGAEMEAKALAEGNTKHGSPDEIGLTDPFKLTAPNFLPKAGSPALSGAVFTGSDFSGVSFWTQVAYRGAFGADNWMANWTSFTPQTNVY
ncbi:MAG TPA: hypothetical protein VLL95_05890, partial [Phnomibacter sp.]|nr:hypothetical protein [Phnomibacter sp.]